MRKSEPRTVFSLFLAFILFLSLVSTAEENDLDEELYNADIVIGYMAESNASVNPFLCNDWDLVSMNQLVFEPLIELDDDQKPSPMLAKSWERNGDIWLFTLRSDIVFHNGESLSSADVESTYQAFLSAGDTNPYYQRIKTFISDLIAVDEHTVAVKAKMPGYIALYGLTFPIIQSSTVFDELPRGTGPYWYVRYDIDRALRIETNPFWWRKPPTVNSIVLRRYGNSSDQLEAIQTGEIDVLSTQSPNAALYRKVADLASIDYGTLTFEMLLPNLSSSSVMRQLTMRQMVMYAMDRTLIASNAYLGMAIPSEVPVLPGTWLYESQSAQYYSSPERALYLLKQMGWKDLTGDMRVNKMNGIQVLELNLRIITYNESGNTMRENAVNMIAESLNRIGVTTTVEVLDRKEVQRRIRNGTYDLALIGVNLSEVPILHQLFISDGSLNLNNYRSSEMDSLLGATGAAASDEALRRAYTQVQIHIVNNLPILGIAFRTGVTLSRVPVNNVSGTRALNTWRGIEYSR